MKKILLLGFALVLSGAVLAQTARLKKDIPTAKPMTGQKVCIEPEKAVSLMPVKPQPSHEKATNVVSVIPLGNSANANGYGYAGGQKTLVWADDTLDAIINIHRMGPGATPPSFSGYLAVDKAENLGLSAGDWTVDWQIYACFLNTGATYYLDAARYPQAAIYNPSHSTNPDDSYIVYFAPNTSNVASGATWGGYSYGRIKYGDQADSTKHLQWYNPPPYNYIPDGFTISHKGIALMTDVDQDWSSGSVVYQNDLIFGYGTWNTTTSDFDYAYSFIPLTTADGGRPANERIAASPDGNDVWIVALGNNGGAVQIGDSANYYPILYQSIDGGLTWSDPIAVQLDGPNGISGIVDYALSDYRIQQLFNPPYPARDEIPYTTAFDCDIVVDKWGNPHIGVVIGVSAGNYSIATGDSNCTVYDIYSIDGGQSWQGQKMGTLKTFRGTFGTLTEDNRTNIAVTESGEYVFVTWNDTHVEGVTTNNQPDVFARGFNLLENKITENDLGEDNSDNVTYLSDVFQQAYFEATSHYVFSKPGGGHYLPIVTELLSNPNDAAQPVTFKYVSDFAYLPSDYTIPSPNPPFPVGIGENKKTSLTAQIYPNPVHGLATLTVNLNQGGNLNVEITNMVGQKVMSFNKGSVNAGTQQFTIDASQLPAGVYFYTLKLEDQKSTGKMVVE